MGSSLGFISCLEAWPLTFFHVSCDLVGSEMATFPQLSSPHSASTKGGRGYFWC